ncbi:MAG: lysophospholipase, partial [Leptolyngbyaceae cyanobacterium MAG.088]|nr:lysophospholipase [Leptolyngbyaceae cyanobacterium MAG.088]
SLSIPVLLMHGTADRVVPAAMSRTLYESWPVNTATLLWVEGAGHSNLPMVAGERYNHTVKTFVTRYAE